MNKPNAYDEAKATGSFEPVELGGHTCEIKQVSETTSRTGAPMIVVLFDFDRDDKQPGYFYKEFAGNTKEGKKWPFDGTCWIMVNDYNDPSKTSSKFKSFCVAFEKSNGTKVKWGINDWGRQFVGGRIGTVYGNEEDEYNGEYRMRPRMKWFCEYNSAPTAKVPEAKYIKNKPQEAAQTSAPAPVDDIEIPF